MTSTYLETLEPVPPRVPERAPQFLGDLEVTAADPSFDLFGGGGVVSTTGDVATFLRALARGDVFDDPATFDLMSQVSAAGSGDGAASGIYRVDLDDQPCWYHEGFWGVIALTCPALDITVVRTINQAQPDDGYDLSDLVIAVLQALGVV